MTNEQLKSKEFHSQNLPKNLLKHFRTTKNVSEYLKMLYNDIAWLRGRAAHTDFWIGEIVALLTTKSIGCYYKSIDV